MARYHRFHTAGALPCALLMAAAACGHRDADPIAALAGVARWTATPDLRIGEHVALSRVSSLAVGGDGAIYVAENEARQIRVFSARGALLRTIGRPGQGPGEFTDLAYLGWHGDTLTAADPVAGRLQLFDAAGRFVSGISLAVRPSGSYPVRLLRDGTVLGQGAVTAGAVANRGGRLALRRWDRAGKPLGEVSGVSRAHSVLLVRNPASTVAVMAMPQPFSDDPLLAFAPDGSGTVVVDRPADEGPALRVTRYAPDGSRTWERTFDLPRERLDGGAVGDSVRARAGKVVQNPAMGAGSVRQAEAWVRRALYRPRNLPAADRVVAGVDGSTWIRLAAGGGAERSWLVLDSAGRGVAVARVPAEVLVFQAGRGQLWGTVEDADDVPSIVRYAVAPGAAPTSAASTSKETE